MLRLALGGIAMAAILAMGCGDSSSGGGGSGGAGGIGGTPMVEPGPTCTALCMKFIGECEAGAFTEEECRQGCQTSLDAEYAHAEACGEAAENVFLCVIELQSCQEVYDWRDQSPRDSYPCRSRVLEYDQLVVQGICLPAA